MPPCLQSVKKIIFGTRGGFYSLALVVVSTNLRFAPLLTAPNPLPACRGWTHLLGIEDCAIVGLVFGSEYQHSLWHGVM